jgi:hypothetical protein
MRVCHLLAIVSVIAVLNVIIPESLSQALLWTHPTTVIKMNIQAYSIHRTSGRSWTRRSTISSTGSPFQLAPFTDNHNRSCGMRKQLSAATPTLGNQDFNSSYYDDTTHGCCASIGTNGYDIFPTTGSRTYNLATQTCCTLLKHGAYGAAPVILNASTPETECCYIKSGSTWMTQLYNTTNKVCCNGTISDLVNPVTGFNRACCGTTLYDVSDVLDTVFECCGNELSGGTVYDAGTVHDSR